MSQKRDLTEPITRNPQPEPEPTGLGQADAKTLASRKIVRLTDLRKKKTEDSGPVAAVFNMNQNSLGKGFNAGVSGQLNLKPQGNSLNFFTGSSAKPDAETQQTGSSIKNDLFGQFIKNSKSGSGLFEEMVKNIKKNAENSEKKEDAQVAENAEKKEESKVESGGAKGGLFGLGATPGLFGGQNGNKGGNLFGDSNPASKLFPLGEKTPTTGPKVTLFGSNKQENKTMAKKDTETVTKPETEKKTESPKKEEAQVNVAKAPVKETPKQTENSKNPTTVKTMPTFGSTEKQKTGLFGSTQMKPSGGFFTSTNSTTPKGGLFSSTPNAPQPKKGGLFSNLSQNLATKDSKNSGLFSTFNKKEGSGLFSSGSGGLFSNPGSSKLFGDTAGSGFFKNTEQRVDDDEEDDTPKEEAPVEVDESKIEKKVTFQEYYQKEVIVPVANFKEVKVGSPAPQEGFGAGSIALEREIVEGDDKKEATTLTIVFRNRAKLVKHQSLVIKGVSGYCYLKGRKEAVKVKTFKTEKNDEGQVKAQQYFVKVLFNEQSEAKEFTDCLDKFFKK